MRDVRKEDLIQGVVVKATSNKTMWYGLVVDTIDNGITLLAIDINTGNGFRIDNLKSILGVE